MSTPRQRFNIMTQFRFIKVGHIAVMLTVIGCTWKTVSKGNEWYLGIMQGIQSGKIDKDAIFKNQAEMKADMVEFKSEMNVKITKVEDRVNDLITLKTK